MVKFKQIVYPYTWVNSQEFNLYSQGPYPVVYTLSYSDLYVYVANSSTTYLTAKKQNFEDYERGLTGSIDFTDLNQAGTDKLNSELDFLMFFLSEIPFRLAALYLLQKKT